MEKRQCDQSWKWCLMWTHPELYWETLLYCKGQRYVSDAVPTPKSQFCGAVTRGGGYYPKQFSASSFPTRGNSRFSVNNRVPTPLEQMPCVRFSQHEN